MSLSRRLSEVIDKHVDFETKSVDRLNVSDCQLMLQTSGERFAFAASSASGGANHLPDVW